MESAPDAPAAPAPDELPEGSLVGEYRVVRKLKAGGMGTVYEAVHQVIEKRAAVKVLKRELCRNDETLQRFLQEARAVNQINHPNIVDVFGFGTTADGRSFLAMELLVGETLGERIGRSPCPLAEACDILIEMTYALEAAHACGVIHRDLKPENVFLVSGRSGPRVKLLDFGIAKLKGGGGASGLTQPGTVIGTPKYMSPEQARGLPLYGSADVYGLGVLAFELFTGRAPFVSKDPLELMEKHVALKPPPPSAFWPSLPKEVDALVAGMLEKHALKRPTPAHVREVLTQLRAMPEAAEAPVRRPSHEPTERVQRGEGRPRRRIGWLIAPPALALVAGLSYGLWGMGGATTVPAVTAPAVVAPAPAEPAAVVAPPQAVEREAPPATASEVDLAPLPRSTSKPHKRPPRVGRASEPKSAEPAAASQPATPAEAPAAADRDALLDPFRH